MFKILVFLFVCFLFYVFLSFSFINYINYCGVKIIIKYYFYFSGFYRKRKYILLILGLFYKDYSIDMYRFMNKKNGFFMFFGRIKERCRRVVIFELRFGGKI